MPGVGVGVEEPELEDLAEDRPRSSVEYRTWIKALTLEFGGWGRTDALDDIHCQNPPGRAFPVDARNEHCRVVGEELPHALRRLGLEPKIELAMGVVCELCGGDGGPE